MKKFTRIEPTIVQHYGLSFPKVAVVKRFRSEDGLEHEFTTTLSENARGGCVIALTPDMQVVTAYQFRPGPERWMWELPGGAFEDDEDPLEGAKRELFEETGYVSDDIEFLGTTCRSAYINETWYCYIAYDCRLSDMPHQADASEIAQGLEVRLISLDQMIEYAKTDQLTDPAAVLMAYDKLKGMQEEHNDG